MKILIIQIINVLVIVVHLLEDKSAAAYHMVVDGHIDMAVLRVPGAIQTLTEAGVTAVAQEMLIVELVKPAQEELARVLVVEGEEEEQAQTAVTHLVMRANSGVKVLKMEHEVFVLIFLILDLNGAQLMFLPTLTGVMHLEMSLIVTE